MSEANIHAAAERMRGVKSGGLIKTVYKAFLPEPHLQHLNDTITLADFALGLLDSEPVDEAWLRSEGWEKQDHPVKWNWYRDDALPIGLWHVDDGWKAMLIHHEHAATCLVRGLKTRGAVRALLFALGGGIPAASEEERT